MNTHYPNHYRRGVASLIGGVFLILIILSGYAFYALSNRATNDLQGIIQKMSILDGDKNQEKLTFNYLVPNPPNGAILYVTNTGSVLININYIGVINDDENNLNPFTDMSSTHYIGIRPGESDSYYIPINTDGTYLISLVTTRGNVFTISYNSEKAYQRPDIIFTSSKSEDGEQFYVSGSNFGSDKNYEIHVETLTNPILTHTLISGLFGRDLPKLPTGSYQIAVTEEGGVLPITSKTLTITPFIGTSLETGQTSTIVHIKGTGFADSLTITINLNGFKQITHPTTVDTDQYGVFSASITINNTPGTYTITATDSHSNTASEIITIT